VVFAKKKNKNFAQLAKNYPNHSGVVFFYENRHWFRSKEHFHRKTLA